MNSTIKDSTIASINQYYIICSLSSAFGLIAIIISIMIVIIVKRSKPRLHTVRHLLICNTAVASIVYCIVQIMNYIILIFLPWVTSDVICRWRGYFGYMSISTVAYSYLIQAISRLLFSVFSTKYRWVTTFKVHYYLILIQWVFVMVIPLPSVITTDIHFRPGALCWVPAKFIIHMGYAVLAYYITPILTIAIIYIYIYKQMKKPGTRTESLPAITNNKRDLEVLRNIVILISIYTASGLPSLIYILSTLNVFYLVGIVTITSVVMIEKICTFLLDRDLRQVMKSLISSRNRIMPFAN